MARKANKELAVDGTAKLAAKAKPGDKHDKPDLTIEEAVAESPRPSRKRTGDFNDFEEESTAVAAAKESDATTSKPRKKAKTGATTSTDKPAKKTKADKPKATQNPKDEGRSSASKAKEDSKPKKEKAVKSSSDAPQKAVKKDTADTAKKTDQPNGTVEEKPKKKAAAAAGASKAESKAKNPAAADSAPKAKKAKKGEETTGDVKEKASSEKPAKSTKPKKDAASKDGAEAKEKPTKTKTASKKVQDVKEKDGAPKATDATKGGAAKSRKRKASATTDPEVVKKDVLDPLAEHASAAKKQKKDNRKSLGESFGDLVNTGIEVAAQGANSLRQSFGGLSETTKGTLTDKTLEVASPLSKAKREVKAPAQKKGKGKITAAVPAPEEAPLADDKSDDDSVLDDQTANLLKGFESSGDDEPAEDSNEGGFQSGQDLPALPDSKATSKRLKAIKPSGKTGTVYLGRIPHGFYEHEIKGYFGQFGDISRLRLSRSRKTGKSKHFAFIEFADLEVAKIVAGTMDNYLMFGHILKCKFVPEENLHADVWKGANKRFKKVPWNKMEGRKLEQPKSKSAWTKKIQGEQEKRKAKAEKSKGIGYVFSLPKLKGVEDLKKSITAPAETTVEEETTVVTTGESSGARLTITEEKTIVDAKANEEGNKRGSKRSKPAQEGGAKEGGKASKAAKRSKLGSK